MGQVRADVERERDEARAAFEARLAAVEEARHDLRARAERAEAELDAIRAQGQNTATD